MNMRISQVLARAKNQTIDNGFILSYGIKVQGHFDGLYYDFLCICPFNAPFELVKMPYSMYATEILA